MNKKVKKILIFIIIISIIFAIWNIIWFANVKLKYDAFEKNVGYDTERQRYYYEDSEQYVYSVSKPNYLQFTGNLAICPVINIDENGNAIDKERADLIIWPSLFGSYKYGVSIQIYKEESNKFEPEYIVYEYELDENKNPIDMLTDEEQKLFNSHSEVIDKLYQKADDMWDLSDDRV